MCGKVMKGILLSLCSLALVSCSGAPKDLVFDLDGFHPNEAGHRELARLFLDLIFPLVKAR